MKFTDKGVVELIVTLNKNNILSFVVRDTGCGMSEWQQQQVFRPFVQVDATTSRKHGGTGLGLVLTQHLCTMLGGEFKLLESDHNKGSTFEVTVKIAVPEPVQYFRSTQTRTSEKNPPKNDRAGILSGLNILVAEDSIDNQELMRLMLSRAGANVHIACNGFEAVEKAESGDYSAILMDIQMPHMDGHEATKILRTHGYEGRIIALTAHAMRDEREKCSSSGFTGYLSKPVQWPVLFHTLTHSSPA